MYIVQFRLYGHRKWNDADSFYELYDAIQRCMEMQEANPNDSHRVIQRTQRLVYREKPNDT